MSKYHSVLGVSPSASMDEVNKAYRKLMLQYHPDKNPDDKEAEKKAKEINEAYSAIKSGKTESPPHQPRGGYRNPMEDLFRGFSFGGANPFMSSANGRNIKKKEVLTFQEYLEGKKVSYTLKFDTPCLCGDTCSACGGRGIETTSTAGVHVSGPCRACRGRGTLVNPSCEKCGGSGVVGVEKKVEVDIPAGIKPGMAVGVSGAGAPPQGVAKQHGDLIVIIDVELPSVDELGPEKINKIKEILLK